MTSNATPASLLALKARKAAPIVTKKTIQTVKKPAPSSTAPNRSLAPSRPAVNGHRKESTPRHSTTPASSRPTSKEPVERIKNQRSQHNKRPSPAASTPKFSSSSEDEDDQPRKRVKHSPKQILDPNRRIRDVQAFSEDDSKSFPMVHAADIANSNIIEHGHYKYQAFFTALAGDEDECPTVELQYPSASQQERYEIVRPNDKNDFKPITEIVENMKMIAKFYVDPAAAEKIDGDWESSSGRAIVEQIGSSLRDGNKSKPGAQTRFVELVNKYNDLIQTLRANGTISKQLDTMSSIPLELVEHIIKNQIYSRTVSPQVHLVRQYEGFSDNVYGELLPRFLSNIFKETRLTSSQIFVDLGSGVGNCVLQAALETGCEAWGCEIMENPARLAELQAAEFPSRCRLWGLKPGPIRLLQDDFGKNELITNILKKADVILINNQAFTAQLNDDIKWKLLDIKEGCKVVSLKYFRDPAHRVKENNLNDPVNVLRVEEKERFSGMVSWSDDPGKWYLHTKDSSEVKAMERRIRESGVS
jgi:[histone H3]-lysine79 N-trimethyltransferase